MMINFEDTERIARQTLGNDLMASTPLQLIREQTIEKPYGWVFFYQSEAFLRTRNFSDMVLGNAPFLVKRTDGAVVIFGTADSIDWYLDQYEKEMGRCDR